MGLIRLRPRPSGSSRSAPAPEPEVEVVDRVAELTSVSQGFQALLKAVSVLMNDVDRGAINELGRR